MGYVFYKLGSRFKADGFGDDEGNFSDPDWSNLATIMAENSDVLQAHRFNAITFSEQEMHSICLKPIEPRIRQSILRIFETFRNGDDYFADAAREGYD
jgi:hypothetical protein